MLETVIEKYQVLLAYKRDDVFLHYEVIISDPNRGRVGGRIHA